MTVKKTMDNIFDELECCSDISISKKPAVHDFSMPELINRTGGAIVEVFDLLDEEADLYVKEKTKIRDAEVITLLSLFFYKGKKLGCSGEAIQEVVLTVFNVSCIEDIDYDIFPDIINLLIDFKGVN